jgi:hypothetical protein
MPDGSLRKPPPLSEYVSDCLSDAKNALIRLDLMGLFSMILDGRWMQVRYAPTRGLAEIAAAPQSRSGFVRDLGLEKSSEILDLVGLFLRFRIHRISGPPKTTIGGPRGTPSTR